MKLVILALAATVAAPALASAPAQWVPAGEPVRCIQASQIRSTRVIDDSTIDFDMGGGRLFRNHLPNRCPGLNSNRAFSYSPTGNQLCNVHTITVIQQGGGPMRGATCGLGQFTPMQRAPATPAK